MTEFVTFGGAPYVYLLVVLFFSRGMDFLSTWVATPNLILEANPIAKRLGWKGGLAVNILLCFALAFWPLPGIIIATTSLLVASRNLQSAWLMRTMGEDRYRFWMSERLAEGSMRLYLLCLLGQVGMFALIGAGLMGFSEWRLVPFAVGMGFITYAAAVAGYTLLSVWRIRRSFGYKDGRIA